MTIGAVVQLPVLCSSLMFALLTRMASPDWQRSSPMSPRITALSISGTIKEIGDERLVVMTQIHHQKTETFWSGSCSKPSLINPRASVQ